MAFTNSNPHGFLALLAVFGILFVNTWTSVESVDAVCGSTGPTCVIETDCATNSDGDYQWCGGCGYYVRCTGGTGSLYNGTNELYPAWDDNKKNFQITSTTCRECYVECPPWYRVPPAGAECSLTGPSCVPGINFCTGFVQMKLFQHCGNCSQYVQCGGLFNPTLIQTCLSGSVWDDNAKTCASSSTTCTECYSPCDGTQTTIVSTAEPSTRETTAETRAESTREKQSSTEPPRVGTTTTKASSMNKNTLLVSLISIICLFA